MSKKFLSGIMLAAAMTTIIASSEPLLAQSWTPLRSSTRGSVSYPQDVSAASSFYPVIRAPGYGDPISNSNAGANKNWVDLGNGARMRPADEKDNSNTLSPEVLETIRQLKAQTPETNYQMAAPVTGAVSKAPMPPKSLDSTANNESKEAQSIKARESYLKFPKGKNIKIAELDFRETPVTDALRSLSQLIGVNLMLQQGITGQVTVLFSDITIEEAFNTLLSAYSLSFTWEGSILRIFPRANAPTVARIFPIQHSNAADVKPIIDRVLTNGRVCEVDTRTNSLMVTDTIEKLSEVASLLPQVDIEESTVDVSSRPVTEVYYLDYVDGSTLQEPIKMLSSAVQIQVFSSSQASQAAAAGGAAASGRMDMMILTDTQNNLDRISELIEKLDVPPIQVTIDAHIYEIDKNREEQAGINWQKSIPTSGSSDDLISLTVSPTSADSAGIGTFRFGSLTTNQFTALLSALETFSFAKVLSNPVITTLNNRQATITVGEAISYVSSSQINAETGQVTTTVGQANADISLVVTPSVTGNDEVFLDIQPTISSVLGYTDLGGNSTPNLSNRTAQTQVICRNNHTIVIGGMIKTDTSKSINKVPFFGDLPGIGKFFQSKTDRETRSELIIFITPHIVYQDTNRKPKHSEDSSPRLTLQGS